jgi:hypothetical protein
MVATAMPPDDNEKRCTQLLVTGMIAGQFVRQDFLQCTVEVLGDGDGNYLPEVRLTLPVSGTRLKITVEVEDG